MIFVVSARYLRPVPGTSYYIYWGRDGHGEESITSQLGSPMGSSSTSVSTHVSTNSGVTGGSRSPLDPRGFGGISSLGDRRHRRGSLTLTDAFAFDPNAAAAAAPPQAPPLFVRFECAHESSSSSSTHPAVDTVASAASAATAGAAEAKGIGERGRGEEKKSVVVDTRQCLSRALKAFPSAEIVPWWVHELAAEEAESSHHPVGGGSGGSEKSKGPQSHLVIFATMCPKKVSSWAALGEGRAPNVGNTGGLVGGSKGISGGGAGAESAKTCSVPGPGAHLSQVRVLTGRPRKRLGFFWGWPRMWPRW